LVNNQANIWALKSLGITRIIAPSAVGSLKDYIKPGDVVISNQFIDFTKKRNYTFYNGQQVCHISCADPFCHELCNLAYSSALGIGCSVHLNSTYVCIEGPRFSTRAESNYYKQVLGADIIGMTVVPECILAREVEICYVSVATVTDYDVWTNEPVTSQQILKVLGENVNKTLKIITEMIPKIPKLRVTCKCGESLSGSFV
jgi:5'-methylthioadenosine phosphorylase